MTEFGDQMKKVRESVLTDGVVTKTQAKREKSYPKYGYNFHISGIDMSIDRVLNDKVTSTMYLYLSMTMGDEETGYLPMAFIQEKNGTKIFIDDKTYKSFFNGLTQKDSEGNPQFPDGRVHCDSDVFPYFSKESAFIDAFLRVIKTPSIITVLKKGYLNMDILYHYMGGGYYSYSVPWFFTEHRSSRSIYVDEISEDNIDLENMHEKLFDHVVAYFKSRGYKRSDALAAVLSNQYYTQTKVGVDTFKGFIALANAYDEPFAIKCFDEYVDNAYLQNFGYESLTKFLTLKYEYTEDEIDYYGRPRHNSQMIYKNPHVDMSKYIQFDKNRLWEYILGTMEMGISDNLENVFDTWADYIENAIKVDGKIKDKYPEVLQKAHDVYAMKWKRLSAFRDQEKLAVITAEASKFCDIKDKSWELVVLKTQNDYLDEAQRQSNCVATYVEKTVRGECWICSFRPRDDEGSCLTVEIEPTSGHMCQIKGYRNRFDRPIEKQALKMLGKFQTKVYKNYVKYGLKSEGYEKIAPFSPEITRTYETLDDF